MRTIVTACALCCALVVVFPILHAQERCETPADMPGGSALFEKHSGGDAPTVAAWSAGAKLPIAKQYHAVASLNGEIYIFGGVTSGNYYNAKSYRFSPATNTWSPIRDFPLGKWLCGQAQSVNGKIYLFGAIENFGTSYKVLPDVFEYDPAADTYTEKTDMPRAQGFAASAVLGNKIYVIAGSPASGTAYQKLVQIYDPAGDTWDVATDYPREVRYVSAATVDNKIVATGGYNSTLPSMYYIADTYVGELTDGVLGWKKVKDYALGPIIFPSGVGVEGKAWFFGGRPSADNNAPATKRSYCYDPAADAWTVLELKPKGTQYLLQAGTDGKKIYLPGGQNAIGLAHDTLDVFDTGAKGVPVIAVAKTTFDLWIKKAVPVTLPMPVLNNGYADLVWTAAVDPAAAAWLGISSPGGTLTAMSRTDVALSLDARALAPGDYSGNITISSNDATRPTILVNVVMHVQEADVDEAQNALIEEFSGTWCGWCPYGADTLKALIAEYPDRVYGMTYHQGNNDPLKTKEGNGVIAMLGVSSYPSAAVNRTLDAATGRVTLGRNVWRGVAESIMRDGRSPVHIEFAEKYYHPVTKWTRFKVRVFFHQGMEGDLRLSVVQTESGLNVGQSFYYQDSTGATKARILYPYFHAHAVRAMLPDSMGARLSDGSPIRSQNLVEISFDFISRDSIAAESELIAFVHRVNNGKPGEVLQSTGEHLLQNATGISEDGSLPASPALRTSYPNPFTTSAVIEFALPAAQQTRIAVYDLFGREVAVLADGVEDAGVHTRVLRGGTLPEGMYVVTMRVGETVMSTRIVKVGGR